MQCNIEWDTLPLAAWQERFAQIHRSNLLQSHDYARAVCPLYRQRARRGLVFIDGREAGMALVLEAGLFGNALHALVLDRGPLWFEGFGTQAHQRAFFQAFSRAFPARPGRRRRVIPECEHAGHLEENGFYRLPRPGYQTVWLDLRPDIEILRANLKKNWRHILGRAERSGVEVVWDRHGEHLNWLLTKYQSERAQKGFAGPSLRVLRALCGIFAPEGKSLLGRALLDNRPIAGILVLCHGSGATYQLGWSGAEGRTQGAQNLLLWQAACHLKNSGFTDFDLGGVNDEAQGIKQFKQGMGGQTVSYAGHFV